MCGILVLATGTQELETTTVSTHVQAPHDASALFSVIRWATSKQVGYIENLLTTYGLHTDQYDRLWKLLESHRLWEQAKDTEDRDGRPMPFQQASNSIDYIKRQVEKHGLKPVAVSQAPAKAASPSIPAGYYAIPSKTGNNDLDFFRIDRPADGKYAGRTFVKRIIGGQPDVQVRGSEATTALQAIFTAGIIESGQLYGRTIGRCGKCHTHLTDEASRERGFGPWCWAQRVAG
jgi:hypothetical protein